MITGIKQCADQLLSCGSVGGNRRFKKVLNLAREDIVWHSVSELITDVPDKEMLGLNIVEFAGDDAELIESQVSTLCQRLDELIAQGEGGVIGWQLCNDLSGIERIYAMRKKAVGLLGNAKGAAKPIPFAEDTCVPPEHLADYIVEFRALLDSHGLSYGMFGHVDAGCCTCARRWTCAIRSRRS